MENCNNLTRFKKYCLDQLDYIYAAWNALSSYSEKLELKNKNLEEEKKTWEEEKKILEEENKVLKEENNILKEEKNLAYKKLEEMTQVLNTFINQNVKQRNIFEEIESPENISANTSTSIEPESQNNYNNIAGPSNFFIPVSPLPPRIEERTIWDEVDDEEGENKEENLEENEENFEEKENLEEENEDDCW